MVRRGRSAATGFWRDFQAFALRGNVVDLAVAVIIGGAFGKIVNSFVEDLLMSGLINPLLAQTGADWRELKLGGFLVGKFLGATVDFVIVALAIFVLVRSLQSLRRQEEEAPAPPPDPQERLIAAIEELTATLQRPQP
ncbi:MAG TPA: large conductance mechanosensitive channel protein MscL [Cyanobacteria bacterium UBA8156]|nr:large conductance mechanosensitive channel protein MscL [Cyanobacteria bacterium UBA8156]